MTNTRYFIVGITKLAFSRTPPAVVADKDSGFPAFRSDGGVSSVGAMTEFLVGKCVSRDIGAAVEDERGSTAPSEVKGRPAIAHLKRGSCHGEHGRKP